MDSVALVGADLSDGRASAFASHARSSAPGIEPPSRRLHGSSSSSAAAAAAVTGSAPSNAKPRPRNRRKQQQLDDDADDSSKRRCVSTACIACRKRKSKCDGNTPACAACSQVYGTDCIYDPNSDHRRKGVYKNDVDNLKTRDSTLQTLIQAILNCTEDEVPALVREIRTCESLDAVAERVVAREHGLHALADDGEDDPIENDVRALPGRTFESQLYGKMGDLRLDDGSLRYIGGTSNLIHVAPDTLWTDRADEYPQHENPVTSWTTVTDDPELVLHLLNMYFTWHYTFFTTMSKPLFYRDFLLGRPPGSTRRQTQYCTPLLVNAVLALGCHFTSHSGALDDPDDSGTAGDHFFREAKRLIMENDEHEKPQLTTVQALALMSVREAGCGREAKGWVYSGMSFRMACDMGLNLDGSQLTSNKNVGGDENEDARRITFWGCYLFDKCWSNYLGRIPQLPSSLVTVSKYDVFPDEDADRWSPYTESGFTEAHAQPSRTRAVSLQLIKLCEISNDIMEYFYNPIDMEKTKGRAVELRKLSDIHTRLETWRRELPPEMEPKEGGLSSVLVMHMFFQLLFIHLFRPFLKYTQATSPLPQTVSPRKLCTHAAAMISKLMRLYKRSHGLRQICNIAVYIAHSACTIHLLNLPDKNARRDILHGVRHLEEIAEGWPCARRTLSILSVLANKWNVELPEEAALILARTDAKYGVFHGDSASPSSQRRVSDSPSVQLPPQSQPQAQLQPQLKPASQPQPQPQPQLQPPQSWPIPGVTIPVSKNVTSQTTPRAQVRTDSGNFGPIQQIQQPQPRQPIHGDSSAPRLRTWELGVTGKPGASPSDMFGGVEQLIRDSNSWTYRDQAQLATGFGNWTTTELDSHAWMAPEMLAGNGIQLSIETHRDDGMVPNGMALPQTGPTSPHQPAHPHGDGQGVVTWLNAMNTYNNPATTYDENDWYQ